MIFLNNCNNLKHEEIYELESALFDRYVDASDNCYMKLRKVRKGDFVCVASYENKEFNIVKLEMAVVTDKVKLTLPDLTKDSLVILGDVAKTLTMPKESMKNCKYGRHFIDINGNFKRMSVI